MAQPQQLTAEQAQDRADEIELQKRERKRAREERKRERIARRKKYFLEKFAAFGILLATVLISFVLKIIFEK